MSTKRAAQSVKRILLILGLVMWAGCGHHGRLVVFLPDETASAAEQWEP